MTDNTARELHDDEVVPVAAEPTQELPKLELVPPPSARKSNTLLWVGLGGGLALIVAGAVVAALYFAGNKKEAAFYDDMQSAMAPVMAANDDVSGALLTLEGPAVAAAQAEVKDAKAAIGDAQELIATFDVPKDADGSFADVSKALRANDDFLDAASAVLIAGQAGKSSPETANLARFEDRAADLYDDAGRDFGVSGHDLDGANALKTWADGRVAKAKTFAKKKANAVKVSAREQGRAEGRAEAEAAASQYNLGRYALGGYDIVVNSGDVNDVFAGRMVNAFKANGMGTFPVESFQNPGTFVNVTCRASSIAYAECGFKMAEYNSILIFSY